MAFRVAAVSFLNTIPLVEWLGTCDSQQIVLTRDLPSRLAGYLMGGDADVALLPVAEILRGNTGGILPVAGIACHGAVDSVKLFAIDDLKDLTRISADQGSRSSIALLRVLLAEMFGQSPAVSEFKPGIGVLPARQEGVLIIGDRCFEYEKYLRESGHNEVQSWDLGQLWWDLAELPFVFATWAVAPAFAEASSPESMAELKNLLAKSLQYGLNSLSSIAERAAAEGRLGHKGYATAAAIDYYFRQSLCYTIGQQELAGIGHFHQLAMKHGILPTGLMPPVL